MTASTISTRLNRGGGSFAPKRDYRTGRKPRSLAIGDLTGDGKPELVTANAYLAEPEKRNPGTVSVFVNKGDGSFRPKHDYRPGKFPSSVAIGDLNGDGKLDLATANTAASTVSVFVNRGDGSFKPRRDYATEARSRSLAIADLNGDGKPDLVTATPEGRARVSVLLNQGDGSFRGPRSYQGSVVFGSLALATGDLNGDRKPDLATANGCSDTPVSVLVNRGDGSFGEKLDYRTEVCPDSVAIGDLNGDGKNDLVTANENGSVSVFLNTPGLCDVQYVVGITLPAAKQTIARAHCRVGKIRRAYSKIVKKGRVTSQKPGFGAVLPSGGRVNLVVSRGRK